MYNEYTTNFTSYYEAEQGVTESLKASAPLEWIRRMNSIRLRAEEVIRTELIYI